MQPRQMTKDNREKDMRTQPDSTPQHACLHRICACCNQLHRLTTCADSDEEEDRDRGEDREGRTKLTTDSLSDLLVGYRSNR